MISLKEIKFGSLFFSPWRNLKMKMGEKLRFSWRQISSINSFFNILLYLFIAIVRININNFSLYIYIYNIPRRCCASITHQNFKWLEKIYLSNPFTAETISHYPCPLYQLHYVVDKNKKIRQRTTSKGATKIYSTLAKTR